MTAYRVAIPIMVTEATEPAEVESTPTSARMLAFAVEATSADEAAQILYERLEPFCADR